MPWQKDLNPRTKNSPSKRGNALRRSEVFHCENTRCMLLLINAI